jgi:formylglycine-generating enzyme
MKKNSVVLIILVFSVICGFSQGNSKKKINKYAGMVLIQSKNKNFIMGLDTSELFKNEPRQGWANYVGKHKVSFTYNFYMDSNLVTQEKFKQLMGFNPSGNNTGDMKLPVEKVSWFDAILYCNARSKLEELDSVYSYSSIERNGNSVSKIIGLQYNIKKNGYRLPTNAEYEFAERANTCGKYFFTTDETKVNEIGNEFAWSINLSGFKYEKGGIFTKQIQTKKPNPWGLYDLVGNLFEWCNDWDAPYPQTNEIDPIGASLSSEEKRVAKGGSYRTDIAYHMRIQYHYKWEPANIGGEIGFRCVATK